MTKHKNAQQAGGSKTSHSECYSHPRESLLKTPQSVCTHNDLGIAEWIFMHRIIRK